MKSKIFSVLFALVLVVSLSLVAAVPAAKVEATPDVSSVWAQLANYTASTSTTYDIYFTPGAALTADTDIISVIFPTGTTPGSVAAKVYPDGDLIADPTYTDATTVVAGGTRVAVTTPVAISAGVEVRLNLTNITNPSSTGDKTLKLYTSQDLTQVTSSTYTIGATKVTGVAFDGTASLVGPSAEYIVSFTAPGTAELVAGWGKVTVIFPPEVTLPASMLASDVAFDKDGGATYTDCTVVPTISGRFVTITVSETLGASGTGYVKFKTSAGIDNPTLAGTTYVGKVYTTIDAGIVDDGSGYAIVAGAITQLAFVTADSAAVVAVSAAATLSVQAQDQYGNPKDPAVQIDIINLTSTSTTGLFEATVGGSTWTSTTDVLTTGNECTFDYKDTVAGSPTITAAESPSLEWTDATWVISVETHVVSLYDSNDVLITTYTSIQAAIDAAMDGDTIKVGPGTYAEDLDINEEITLTGVTAAGANAWTVGTAGADATAPTITYDGSHGHMIKINADDVTFQGFNIDTTNVSASRAVHFTSVDNSLIQYNTFTGASRAINISDDWSVTDLTVTYNVFTGSTTEWGNWLAFGANAGIAAADQTYNVFSYNTVTGYMTGRLEIGTRDIEDIMWLNNSFSFGFTLTAASDGGDFGDLVLKGNSFTGAPSTAAFEVLGSVEDTDWETGALGPEDVIIYYNDFSGYAIGGNETVRVVTTAAENIDARYNWWGSTTGPYHATANPNGTGADVDVDDVDYSPWSHKLYADVVANNAKYPALNTALSVGWNTLSTPAKLISTADAIDELVPTGSSVAYYYDSGWVLITSGYVLNPCDAIYIKMDSAQNVLFLIDGAAFHVPSKDLAAGWNLIGQANLTDTESTADAVASVTGSYSQLVSPSMNSAEWVDTVGALTHDLVLGEGYWIFMTSAATLAGFTLCPIAP